MLKVSIRPEVVNPKLQSGWGTINQGMVYHELPPRADVRVRACVRAYARG